MKSVEILSKQELIEVSGGCQIGDCGNHPIIIITPTLPYPDPIWY